MQGLVGVSLIFEEISNINVKCVKVTGVQNISQGHQVKVPAIAVHPEEAQYKVWWLKALYLRHMEERCKCKSQWSAKYRSRSPVKVPAESVH